MRESGKAIGASVGRMMFANQSAKRIERHLEKTGGEKLAQALSKRGLGGMKNEDIAKALTGELRGRAGWSQGKMKNVVAALQDAGLAHTEKSASHMVLQASKNIDPEQKERLKALARERRKEANLEEAAPKTVREIRETLVNRLGLKPRIVISKPKKEDAGLTGFQA